MEVVQGTALNGAGVCDCGILTSRLVTSLLLSP